MSKIDGFSIAGYRSFGPTEVQIPALSRLNLFIGKNNCGKSNILRFLKRISMAFRGEKRPFETDLDYFLGEKRSISFSVQIRRDGISGSYQRAIDSFQSILPEFADRLGKQFWVGFVMQEGGGAFVQAPGLESLLKESFNAHEINRAATIIGGGSNYSSPRYGDVAARICSNAGITVDVRLIEAFRKISQDGDDSLTGSGLIKSLAHLKSPEYGPEREAQMAKFKRIERFVGATLGEAVVLDIPAAQNRILINLNGRTLPLESLGTGIHQVVVLAAAVTLIENAVVCIEEPEIYCHPELQKKFARYLLDETTNQYLIATHSNAFLDMEEANTYRCWLDKGQTQCELALAARDKHSLLFDLGYRPSDLLQANCVVWVEGPSDRIYLKHWLRAIAPDLDEGLDFILMFYGGALLSHLAYESLDFDEQAVQDFIQLCRLNRSACIVIDSDKKKDSDGINDTKKRIIAEFEDNACPAWVTTGRTIENYIAAKVLADAIKAAHPSFENGFNWTQFDKLPPVSEKANVDKVAVARSVVTKAADFSPLDLQEQLTKLADYIRNRQSKYKESTPPSS